MTGEEKTQLLGELKNYLDITWPDEAGDRKLQGMMERGMASLAGVIGECDFLGDTEEKTLLFSLVMYERAGDLNQFWQHYQPEILGLQISRKADRYAEKEKQTV